MVDLSRVRRRSRGRSRNTEMPTFFVIGAAKCGTTSLHHYLNQHPEISMSEVKEPRYFCRHLEDFRLPVVSNRDEYIGLFEPGTVHRGESSPAYSEWAYLSGVPEAISREIEDPRFIYLVRDPIERFASSIQEEASSGHRGLLDYRGGPVADPGFELSRMAGRLDDHRNPFTTPGLYMTQLRQYLDFFPADSILVIDSDDLRYDRRRAMAEVFAFLGLEPVFDPIAIGVELNSGDEKKVVSGPYRSLTRSSSARKAADLLPEGVRSRLVTGVRSLGPRVSRPNIELELRARLEDLYRAEVEELREFTGKPFSSWSI